VTARRLALVGAALGLLVSVTILSFLWRYGILEWRIGGSKSLDLTLLLWPSSVMLVDGWRRTVPGILITLPSVVINCLIYAVIAGAGGSVITRIRRFLTRE
jgi:hypothetical protein